MPGNQSIISLDLSNQHFVLETYLLAAFNLPIILVGRHGLRMTENSSDNSEGKASFKALWVRNGWAMSMVVYVLAALVILYQFSSATGLELILGFRTFSQAIGTQLGSAQGPYSILATVAGFFACGVIAGYLWSQLHFKKEQKEVKFYVFRSLCFLNEKQMKDLKPDLFTKNILLAIVANIRV